MSRKIKIAVVALGASLSTGVAVAAPPAAQLAPDTVRSAKVAATPDFADPSFARFDLTRVQTPRYFMYATGKGFPMINSATAVGGYGKPKVSMTAIPTWVATKGSDFWAPHVTRRADGDLPGNYIYTMFFNARRASDNKHCIGVATSNSPTGFEPRDRPLLCPPEGYDEVLDPSIYSEDGVRYLVYKLGDNNGVRRFSILARPLNVSSTEFTGEAIVLLGENQTKGINAEAPDILRAGQRTHLFVSRNGYQTVDYATQSWSASSIEGLASSTGRWVEGLGLDEAVGLSGPGGAEVIEDGDQLRIAFHSHHDRTPDVPNEHRLAYSGTLDRDGDQFSLR